MSRFIKIILLGSFILPLQAAEMSRRQNPCENLVKRLKHFKNHLKNLVSDYFNHRLLLAHAIEKGDLNLAKLAIIRGVDVNHDCWIWTDYGTYTPLERAIKKGDAAVVKLLLDHKVDIKEPCYLLESAIKAPRNNLELVKLFLDQSIDPNSSISPFTQLSLRDNIWPMEYNYGRTVIDLAIGRGKTEIVKELYERGAIVNKRSV